MSDYVSRQYLLDEYDRQHQGPPGGARKIIAEAPAEDVAPVVHGKWIKQYRGQVNSICSVCGKEVGRLTDFCPHCGAKMDEE